MGLFTLINGWWERAEESLWRPEWLDPRALAAHSQARAASIVTALGKSAPESWRHRIASALTSAEQAGELMLRLQPGPLDALDDRWEGLAVLDEDQVSGLAANLNEYNLLPVAYCGTLLEHQKLELRANLEMQINRCLADGIAWDQGLDATLHLAGRWRDTELAELAFASVLRTGAIRRAAPYELARIAFDCAIASENRAERLKQVMERLAMADDLSAEGAAALFQSIDVAGACEKNLVSPLARARAATSMKL
jgi:hypothetical protein